MTYLDVNTAAIILSGGAGTRLNGVDKGLQQYKDKFLIEHVILALEPQVDSIYLCANRNLNTYLQMGYQVVPDQKQNYQGPMSGISSALKTAIIDSDVQQILVSSCDAPHLPSDLREKLQDSLIDSLSADVSVVHDGKRQQNLHCLIKRQAWSSLISFFDSGGRAMRRWFSQVNTVHSDFSDSANCFINLNTIEQLKS